MKNASCKRLLALVLAAAMILSLAPVQAWAAENGNLALGKAVTVSSYEDGTSFDGSKITDGDRSTASRWGTGQNAAAGEWAEIDLGAATAIKQIDIYFERSDAEQNILSYQVEFFANGAYTTVYTKSEKALQHECIVLEEAESAEKVKITVLDADGGTLNWVNVGIVEVELYGDTHAEELPANPNIALGKPATASNVEGGTSFTADKAVDGSTAAGSRWATDQNVTNPWIEIDLDDGSVIKQINIMFERAGANQNILDFIIEAEVNGAYQTIYDHDGTRSDQRLTIVLDEAVTADKMKLTVTSYDGGTSNWASVSIIEIEVYSAESVSLGDIAQSLNAVSGTVVTGDTFELPEAPAGTTVELNGADLEQLIAKDGSVQHPLTDKTVNVSFKVSDGTNTVITGDIPVTVKGLYTQGEGNAKPVIIPEIQEWYSDSGDKLAVSALTKVTYDDAALKAVVDEFVADYEALTGVMLTAVQGAAEANAINFSLTAPDALLGEEGYTMQILSDRINVASCSTTGNMFGMQTILQMVRTDAQGFAIGQMRDYPRFTIRGLLLDMARKPIAMTMVGDIARTMRYYKMNDLQLHLNDNYIWLEEYGTYENEDNGFNAYEAFRLESSLTNAAGEDPTAEDYAVSKEEMRTFIQTQRSLGMNIVPEIDVPAHAMAFTKVWPELSIDNEVRNGHTLIDHFNLSDANAIAKIKAIFDDYTRDTETVPATFDSETTVHVGADEYYLSGTLYRQYFNDIVPYIKQTNTVRIWGSLTQMNDNNQTKIIPEAIEDVQMNIWSAGWANYQDMFDMGFGLINTIDVYGYMVPNGNGNRGGYGDYLNLDSVFSSYHANQVGGITLPSGDDRVLGAAFAIWNDNIDRKASGLTESDIFVRFFNALPLYAEKTWAATGQEKGSAEAITKLAKTIGVAPNTDPYFQIETEGETHAAYAFETMLDASGNGRDLIAGTATVADGFLTLSGGNSYVGTPIKKLGNLTSLSFDITLTEEAQPGMILFETTPEYYTHDIRIMDDGTLGFTRELYDYSFGYTLPVGETVHIEIVAEQQLTSLYVDGELVGTATGKFVLNGDVKKTGITHSTFALPLERIGSETNAIKAVIENLSVDKVIVKDYSDDSRDIPVEVLTATTGDWQTGYEATEGPAHLVLDGDPGTIWHTNWYGTSRENHWIQFELSENYTVDGLRYLPRSGSNNGIITKYEIQISDDGVSFETIASGSWANSKDWKAAEFEGVQAKFVRLVAVDAVTDNSYVFASAAEIRLTGEAGEPGPVDPPIPDEPGVQKIFHLDSGRKLFSKDWTIALLNELSAAGYTHLQLAFGNNGFRFVLDDMTIEANGTIYASDDVKAGIELGNKNYYDEGEKNALTEAEMDEILAHAAEVGVEIIPHVNMPGHMNALLDAMEYVGISGAHFTGSVESASSVNLNNEEALSFMLALVDKYAKYFSDAGSKYFHVGADEYANDAYNGNMGFPSMGATLYNKFAQFVNDTAAIAKGYGMTPRAWNDGVYYGSYTAEFDSNIEITYWSSGWWGYNLAKTSKFIQKGNGLINTHGDYYYILGKDDKFTEGNAATHTPGVYQPAEDYDITRFMDGSTVTDPVGGMFCVWCDYPDAETETEVAANIRLLLRAMALRMDGKTLDGIDTSVVEGGFNEDGTINGEIVHEHSYEAVVTEPTCTEGGYTTYTCECGDSYIADETPALGHDWQGTGCTRCDATRNNPFVDVPEDSFYIDPVLWAVEKGITNGMDETHFAPQLECNRAQIVTFLWRAAGAPEVEVENPFADVTEADFYYNAVLWAVSEGITTGVDAEHFNPTGICNRSQVVTFLWRYLDKPEAEASNSFTDVVAGSWYADAIDWAVEAGVTTGMGNGTFGVGEACNRAQAVTFLYRALAD